MEKNMSQFKRVVSKLVTNEKTPIVLTVVACTGVIATGIMAAKAAPKASRIIADEKARRLKDKLRPFEYIKHTWKYYAPAVGVGSVTILAIITMNRVSTRNAAILTAGATLATTTLQEYQQHVLEEIGSERESKVRDKMAKSKVERSDVMQAEAILITGAECLCYDEFSGRYFKSSAEDLREIENDINRQILSEIGGAVSLNEVYFAMGLDDNEVGNVCGFNIDTPLDFHFSGQLTKDRKPVLSVGFIHLPVEDYANFT
jgi:hypothetical protein